MEEEESVRLPITKEDFGKLQYGCEHYRRRCKIRAPCCDKIFPCRHCHNEAVSSLSNPTDHHELIRQNVKQVVCSLCNTEQEVAQICSNCGVNMGEYFCNICNFYDDDVSKGQFHCDDCGICRVGGRDEFFHCQKCGSCYSVCVRDNHVCVENSMKNYCPVCYEYLFDSIKGSTVMKCGHTMHTDCFQEMAEQNQYRCPICSKTVLNMSDYWRLLDMEDTSAYNAIHITPGGFLRLTMKMFNDVKSGEGIQEQKVYKSKLKDLESSLDWSSPTL